MVLNSDPTDIFYSDASASELLALYDALPKPVRRVLSRLMEMHSSDSSENYDFLGKLVWLLSGLYPDFVEEPLTQHESLLAEYKLYTLDVPLPKLDIKIVNDQLYDRIDNPFLRKIRSAHSKLDVQSDRTFMVLSFVEVLHEYIPMHVTKADVPQDIESRRDRFVGIGTGLNTGKLGGKLAGLDTSRRGVAG